MMSRQPIQVEPRYCELCGAQIVQKRTVRPSRYKTLRFCGWRCSALHGGDMSRQRKREYETPRCKFCRSELVRHECESSYAYRHRSFCDRQCMVQWRAEYMRGHPEVTRPRPDPTPGEIQRKCSEILAAKGYVVQNE